MTAGCCTRVLRWSVRIDGGPQEIGGGDVVLVAERPPRWTGLPPAVDVWTAEVVYHDWPATDPCAEKRFVQVAGTGQPVPLAWRPLGSCVGLNDLIWHVFDVPPP